MALRERLRQWMKEHPNPCDSYTLDKIGKELGVTREAVRQHMPDYTKNKIARRRRILAEYVEQEPRALIPKQYGGLTLDQMASAIGYNDTKTLSNDWNALGLPDRKLLRKVISDNEAWRTVIRTEECWACGKEFGWTRRQERFFKIGKQKTKVCSKKCGHFFLGKTREEAYAFKQQQQRNA